MNTGLNVRNQVLKRILFRLIKVYMGEYEGLLLKLYACHEKEIEAFVIPSSDSCFHGMTHSLSIYTLDPTSHWSLKVQPVIRINFHALGYFLFLKVR